MPYTGFIYGEIKMTQPILVHLDARQTLQLIDRTAATADQILDRLLMKLIELTNNAEIWVATFAYNFFEQGKIDINRDPSQVGLLSEFARNKFTLIRPDPVFRVNIYSPRLSTRNIDVLRTSLFDNDLFGEGSLFSDLIAQDGSVFWFGAPLSAMTLLHYIERRELVPYRYQKKFFGTAQWNNNNYEIESDYYVRPKGLEVGYDLSVRELAVRDGIIKEVKGGNGVCFEAKARELFYYFSEQVKTDPLYLLNEKSKNAINAELDRLGRAFQLTDFEHRVNG